MPGLSPVHFAAGWKSIQLTKQHNEFSPSPVRKRQADVQSEDTAVGVHLSAWRGRVLGQQTP